MARAYYVLGLWDTENRDWFDECGHYALADAKADKEAEDYPRGHAVILKTDGSLADLIAQRNALAPPKGQSRG